MSKQGLYALRISGLGEGDHDFSFELDQRFFASLEHSEIEKGNVQAQVILKKKHGLLSLHFTLAGEVEVICDRCLELFMTQVSATQDIFVKIGKNPGEVADDVVVIEKDDHEIDVGQSMYEFIILALPFKRIHPSDNSGSSMCNPEMLEKLDAHGKKITDKKDQTDPRWEALKGIIEKNT